MILPTPTVGASSTHLAGVAADADPSSTDVWAVGARYTLACNPCIQIEHRSNGTWDPNVGSESVGASSILTSVIVPSTAKHDIWAVGSYKDANGTPHPLLETWNGSQFTRKTTPNGDTTTGVLNGLTKASQLLGSPTSSATYDYHYWLAGYTLDGNNIRHPYLLHWDVNTATWSSPSSMTNCPTSDAFFNSIDSFSWDDIWAVGAYDAGGGKYHPLLAHLDDSGWTCATDIAGLGSTYNELHSIFFNAARDVYAVGEYSNVNNSNKAYPNPRDGSRTFVMHWHGSSLSDIGQKYWDYVPVPTRGYASQLLGVAAPTSGFINSIWVAGNYLSTGTSAQTLIETLNPPAAPTPIASYYVETLDKTQLKNTGLAAGDTSGVIILDFGMPIVTAGGNYGALLISVNQEADTQQIATAVEAFADGYHVGYCATHPGACFPGPISPPIVTIAIGVNNQNGFSHWTGQLNPQHAAAWANMVSNVKNYVNSHMYHEIAIAAAMDIEPGFGDYAPTSSWTNKYKASGISTYFNFGSTDSYPCDTNTQIPRPTLACSYEGQSGNNGWYVGNFYDVSWVGAQAFPEIYNANPSNGNYGILEARYWYVVKRWSYDHTANTVQFAGASMPGPTAPIGTENWRDLWLQLNGDLSTRQDLHLSTYYSVIGP